MNNFKLIIYEFNEAPRRVIDFYIKLKPKSNLGKFVRKGKILNTFTNDVGELHPWSTWPSVHRGVNNQKHKIKYINQIKVESKKYPPIWEILLKNKLKIGIFGSLQSFPPIMGKNNVSFYLPDTFAPDPDAIPKELIDFQTLNLELVNDNKAISRPLKIKNVKNFIKLFIKNTISLKSSLNSALHIFKEFFNKKYKTRRSVLQAVISFDLYMKYLERTKPRFSTYFTNHLAGMMHRYWKYLFPSDFEIGEKNIDKFHSKSIIKAMDIFDSQLGRLNSFCKKENYDLWVVSGLGQEAIDRGEYIPEIFLKDFSLLIQKFNIKEGDLKILPSMQPDICIAAKDKNSFNLTRAIFSQITDSLGNRIFIERYKPVKLTLNLFINISKAVVENRVVYFGSKKYSLEEIGLEIFKRDIGTGYHCPEGILIANGDRSLDLLEVISEEIDICKIAPTIINLFGLDIPKYMLKSL